MPLPLASAFKIASYGIRPTKHSNSYESIELSQALHRIRLINSWGTAIRPGTRVLELGCGQGTCTQALAEAVSASDSESRSGHITAVDPGDPDYGAPFTLSQAQGHLESGPIGPLVTFRRADSVPFLAAAAEAGETWDAAVLAHCIWYFPSSDTLAEILSALKGRVGRVCVAEWGMRATELAAVAHVLAALARATFEAHRVDSSENIQTLMSPQAIKEAVARAGWKVEKEDWVVPERGLGDGHWETATVVNRSFADDVEREVTDQRVKALLGSARDATIVAADAVGGAGRVMSMDVWTATLVPE